MTTTIRRYSLSAATLFVALMAIQGLRPPCALAQAEAASVSGRVTDQQSAVIPDVEVEIKNVATGVSQTTKTNGEGFYNFPFLPPGNYLMNVRKQQFRTVSVTRIVLNVQDSLSRNFVLQLGSSAESITVTVNTPNVDTADASVGTVVDRQFVENMPLNGRSFQTLITLAPGVLLTPANYNQEGQFSVNGQRADANYMTVDGVSANVAVSVVAGLRQDGGGGAIGYTALGGTNGLVSVDAMQGFRIQTSTFAPEFGRTPGAQISIVTRSGANDFHGTIFDYFRNDVLDASNWFANQSGLPKPAERQNDFGGVLGGPIVKDKTFFFLSYEGLRLRLPQTVVTDVPSLAVRTATVPQAQPLLNAFPQPNGPTLAGGLAQFTGSYTDPSTVDSGSVRVDHSFNSKLSIFGRYSNAPSQVTQRAWNTTYSVLSNPSFVSILSQVFTLGLTETLTPSLVNELRFNYSTTTANSSSDLDSFGGATPPSNSTLFPSFTSPSMGVFAMYLVGTWQYQVGKLANNQQRQINVVDNLSKAIGSHQLKFGVDYRRLFPISQSFAYLLEPVFLSVAEAETGVPLETEVAAHEKVPLVYNNFSLYAQDTWKALPRLTFTYGLRWDLNPAPHAGGGETLTALQNVNNPATINIAPTGTRLYKTTYGNFAPRIGVAYQLPRQPGRETVLRGGFGIFYDLGYGDTGLVTGSVPFASSNLLFFAPFPLTTAQATPPPFTLNAPYGPIYATDPNLISPRTYQWNFAIEQSLGASQTFSVTYVGELGRDLLRYEEYVDPNANFGSGVLVTTNAASSNYNALQLQLKRRLAHGLQALASYTWSHSLDNASSDAATYNTSSFYNPSLDRGDSDYDIRNSFSAALNYDIPAPHLTGVAAALLRSWAVDTYFLAYSAPPVDLIGSEIYAPPYVSILRPDIVSGQPFYLYGSPYPGGKAFNPAAFKAPPAGQQGDLGRNVLRGFGAWQQDFAVRRQFQFTERVGLQFRAELFNIYNHPNFGPPGNMLGTPQFGVSSQTYAQNLGSGGLGGGFSPLYQVGGPRSVQLALKLVF
jgi:hypothetical protein